MVAQTQTLAVSATPSRIVERIDNTRLTRLTGNTHPAVRLATDRGLVAAGLPMDRMLLVLRRSSEQQAALDSFMVQQYEPGSPNFHHWLSPQQIGRTYGVSDSDLAQITAWLQSFGFAINSVSQGRIAIEFSGTAAQVQQAFHTEIHNYTLAGVAHIANATDPQIPRALTPVVTGIQSLHNFFPVSQMVKGPKLQRDPSTGKMTRATPSLAQLAKLEPFSARPAPPAASGAKPLYTGTEQGEPFYFVSPFDFATIYNSTPLWNAGNNGSGVHIAIVAVSDIQLSDVATFQSMFGLPSNPPSIIHNGPDPGVPDEDDQVENTLDTEWSGAAAPGAKVDLVVTGSTATTFGGELSALYIIDNQVAPILSASYGQCELGVGIAGNAFFNSLWQQASAQGISAFVSSGDQLATGCDDSHADTPYAAGYGLAVNGFASTPWNTAVGGTDFNEGANYSTYWNATNAANGLSAKGYIPEIPWNDSCSNSVIDSDIGASGYTPDQTCNLILAFNTDFDFLVNVIGGSGGASACTTSDGATVASCSGGYAKPSWQTATGVPVDGKRDLPDISFFAADGTLSNAYAVEFGGSLIPVGGTSISSPAMAGIMALIVQKQGTAQGLANPPLYQLSARDSLTACNSNSVTAGNACVFYDTTTAANSAVCTAGSPNCTVTSASQSYYAGTGITSGYAAASGYDLATGLGSANIANLVNAWNSVSPATPVSTITLTPATLPAVAIGVDYYEQLTASGGTPPYTYFVSAGTLPSWLTLTPNGLLTGVPPLVGTSNFTITARDSGINGPFSGSQAYQQIVAGVTVSTISWAPSTLSSYTGIPLGAGVLDATTVAPGTFAYTATLANDSSPFSVTAATLLAAGSYTLTATFTPTVGATSTATVPFTVTPEHIWVTNTTGSLVGFDAGGNYYAFGSGGGKALAIDGAGSLWSGDTDGTTLAGFANTAGNTYSDFTPGGLNNPAALAIDGNGYIWSANTNNSVSAVSPLGVSLSPSTGFTGGSLSTPSGIAIDISGNVWISNSGSNSVTEILGAAAPVEPLAPAQSQNNLGVQP